MRTCIRLIAFVCVLEVCSFLCPSQAAAQTETALRPINVGVGMKVSLLGAGAEAAVPITRRTNIRGGVNFFSYDRTFDKDGVSYAGQLRFRSTEAHFDWFPFGGGFHLSPGVLIYNGNRVTANALVSGGNTFTLNDTTYASDPSDPIHGTGKITFKKTAPMFTIGWGNLAPRHKHFVVPFEIGAIYQDAPRASLQLSGSACDSTGANCSAINSDPSFQGNVAAEQNKLNHDMSPFKFYPVISAGLGFRF